MLLLDIADYTPFIICGIGLSLIIVAVFYKEKKAAFKDKCESAEGIVFERSDFQFSSNFMGFRNETELMKVRFVTKKGEWITKSVFNKDIVFTYTGQFKEGDKVEIIYNREDPKDFQVKTIDGRIVQVIFAVAGTLIFFYGLVQILSE